MRNGSQISNAEESFRSAGNKRKEHVPSGTIDTELSAQSQAEPTTRPPEPLAGDVANILSPRENISKQAHQMKEASLSAQSGA